jgi:hypothetical protein
MMLTGGSSKPPAAADPLALIDKLPSHGDEASARQLCQHVLARELGREPVYRRLLEVCLGFCQRPMQVIEGGWMAKPRGGSKDARVPLLTSDPRCAWNALHILRGLRDTREVQLDESLLPYRTQDFLAGERWYEEVATENATRLWQHIYYARTLPRAAPAPAAAAAGGGGGGGTAGGTVGQLPPGGGGINGSVAAGGAEGSTGLTRLPLLLPLLDHYFFCFAFWAVARKRSTVDPSSMSMCVEMEIFGE